MGDGSEDQVGTFVFVDGELVIVLVVSVVVEVETTNVQVLEFGQLADVVDNDIFGELRHVVEDQVKQVVPRMTKELGQPGKVDACVEFLTNPLLQLFKSSTENIFSIM